jgi:hypothetical protein
MSTRIRHGVPWLCVQLHAPERLGSSEDCTDPETGFAAPTFESAVGWQQIVVLSTPRNIESVTAILDDGHTITADKHDTGSGKAPLLYFMNLGRDPLAGTIELRAGDGSVRERVRFEYPPRP